MHSLEDLCVLVFKIYLVSGYRYFVLMNIYMSVPGAQGGQKKVSGPLWLEVHMVLSPLEKQEVLLTTEPLLQFPAMSFCFECVKNTH